MIEVVWVVVAVPMPWMSVRESFANSGELEYKIEVKVDIIPLFSGM